MCTTQQDVSLAKRQRTCWLNFVKHDGWKLFSFPPRSGLSTFNVSGVRFCFWRLVVNANMLPRIHTKMSVWRIFSSLHELSYLGSFMYSFNQNIKTMSHFSKNWKSSNEWSRKMIPCFIYLTFYLGKMNTQRISNMYFNRQW
jgi:hypothetical protein